MNTLIWFYVIITFLIAAITSLTLWARKKALIRICALSLAFITITLSYISLLELLSRPKPKELELLNRNSEEVTLLHVSWLEEEAIYILIEIEELAEPRLYKFPWNTEMAQKFDEAMEQGRENGESVKISNPFTSDTEARKTLVYTAPASPLPPKEAPQPGITSYDPDAEIKSYENQKKEYEEYENNKK
tara:strand:- start:237 stop:803 length:567 start_codon:yes stop_codon:yes gene_type:complete